MGIFFLNDSLVSWFCLVLFLFVCLLACLIGFVVVVVVDYLGFVWFFFCFLFLFLFCMYVCMRVSDHLAPQLQTFVNCHVDSGNWTRDLQKSSQCSWPLSHLSRATLFLKTNSLIIYLEFAGVWLGWSPANPSDLNVFTPPLYLQWWGQRATQLCLAFVVGPGDLNSGPHACMASTLIFLFPDFWSIYCALGVSRFIVRHLHFLL